MCGRFTLHHTPEEVARRFDVARPFDLEARYNVAPGTSIAAVTLDSQGRKIEELRWGLIPFWAKDPSIGNRMINARVETLVEKASFKYALTRRRCLIPADGFFEWKEEHTSTSKKKKQPMHIRMKDSRLFAFAGLWEEWRDKENPDEPSIKSATIITGPPNRLLSTLHHRMAVILEPEEEAAWLDPNLQEPEEILRLLKVFPDEAMEAFAISTRINTPAYDAPDCIEPMDLSEQVLDPHIPAPRESEDAQRTLF